MTGDLHTHTHLSDGSMTPSELVECAKASGLGFIGITDHDTLMTKAQAKQLSVGITVIGGAEFSAIDTATGRKVHLLCFAPDDEDRLLCHCEKIQKARDEAGMKMLKAVQGIYPVPTKSVLEHKGISKSLFKQHIMHSLVERGYALEFYGKLYKELFGSAGSCYQSVFYPTVDEMTGLIRECGGVCILAHPCVYDSMKLAYRLAEEHKIDGIEVKHYSADEKARKELAEICSNGNLIVTGGSDFHGLYSSTPRTVGYCTTEEKELHKILKR